MDLLKNILAGISVVIMVYVVVSIIVGARAPGWGFIFALPALYLMMIIGAIGCSIAAILLLTRKISAKGANIKTIRTILLFGLFVFILIIIKTFWKEFFR